MKCHRIQRTRFARHAATVRPIAPCAPPLRFAGRGRLVAIAGAMALAIWLAAPGTARAGWPLESAAPVGLEFGAAYPAADGTSATHRGVDLASAEGAAVRAPIRGRATFVGRVPAKGGGTVLAVTVAAGEDSITLLPLSSACIEKGDVLAEGDAIGELAGAGDDSSAEPHLHVGAKRGELYVDPLSVIAAPPLIPGDAPEPSPAVSAGEEEPAGALAQAASPAPATAGVTALATASDSQAASGVSLSAAAVSAPVSAPGPGTALAPGVSLSAAEPAIASPPSAAAAEAFSAGLRRVRGAGSTGVSLGGLTAWLRNAAARGLWAGARLLVAILAALGALWPIWRRDRGKGSCQLSVRPSEDDVAAVAGRW